MTEMGVEFKTYSAQETAKMIGVDRHLMPLLHEQNILLGIKTGRGRRYSLKEIEEFWEEYRGSDLSNAECIRMTATKHRVQRTKKRAID